MRFFGLARTLHRYWKMANDPRTPKIVKYLIVGGVGFTLIPDDWLPDWMPSLSLVDEAAILPSVIGLSMLLVPDSVKRDHADGADVKTVAKRPVAVVQPA